MLSAYLAVAALCWLASHQRDVRRDRRAIFWRLMAILLVLVGALSELGGIWAITGWARGLIERQGTYADRSRLQIAVIVELAVGAAVAIGLLIARRRRAGRAVLAAASTLILLLLLVGLRIVSLHGLDHIFWMRIGPISIGRIIELTLLTALAAVAVTRLHRSGWARPRI
jgi:hypothetical protein